MADPDDVSHGHEEQGMLDNPFISFIPILLFTFVAGPKRYELGAALAVAAAIVLMVLAKVSGRTIKILDVFQVAVFVVLLVLGFVVSDSVKTWLESWANSGSWLLFGALMGLTLLIGMPFTEQYAKEHAPKEVWDTPLFKQINRVITGVWTLTMLAAGVVACAGQAVTGVGSQNTWTTWVIPIALIVLAVKFTGSYPDLAKRRYMDQYGR